MADDGAGEGSGELAAENTALGLALGAEHAAIWGYGVVGAALEPASRGGAGAAEAAHRDVRDRVVALLAGRSVEPTPAEGGYALPFPVLSGVDAAALAVVLEDGVAAAWVRVLDQAAEPATRELALEALSAAEVRAVSWRSAAGQTPVTRALPGL
ncbi:ferritin-like domain-containing protein [Blastococcus sp. TML/M2B]|uniref:ferritin-like domain-containing protein n=1 Tax=unclassified Blastococcus TaxID=2619396 RepID=UPI00190A43E3|nr:MULTISPECIES: ferritin-like domain-containing protein [unclassified Blastococcus]MBN1093516.1 ferritin-like domain-containing protein [Blastococcus sp. TML/M2B]MBN1096370.1 ferritin-like domain-containing protein [Blastococcus sp. TML/C7B]